MSPCRDVTLNERNSIIAVSRCYTNREGGMTSNIMPGDIPLLMLASDGSQ